MTTEAQQEELRQLKAQLEERRSNGRRLQYSKDVRQRVQALRKAGVAVARLERELGIGPSVIYKWRNDQDSTETTAPRVMTVTPEPGMRSPTTLGAIQPSGVDPSLSLQIGAFSITIKMAGG
jgi:hypothetical protein